MVGGLKLGESKGLEQNKEKKRQQSVFFEEQGSAISWTQMEKHVLYVRGVQLKRIT